MPLEFAPAPAARRAADLNDRFRGATAFDILGHALSDPMTGPVALVSSFGTEAVALLHMVSILDRSTPVLFLDTEMLFPETLEYQERLAEELGLTGVRVVRPGPQDLATGDPDGRLHLTDTDACCGLRKVGPLERALEGFDGWITGRKRFQGGTRVALDHFEADRGRLKINPLAHWSRGEVAAYIAGQRLPPHPLISRGYPSVGCAPCTTTAHVDEDPRAGRWRTSAKTECGIHFAGGRAVRSLPAGEVHP